MESAGRCRCRLSPAGVVVAVQERGQNALRCKHPGHQIGDHQLDALRSSTRHTVRFAGDAHQPAHGLEDGVVTGPLAQRPCLTKAGDRPGENQSRIDGRSDSSSSRGDSVASSANLCQFSTTTSASAHSFLITSWPAGVAISSSTNIFLAAVHAEIECFWRRLKLPCQSRRWAKSPGIVPHAGRSISYSQRRSASDWVHHGPGRPESGQEPGCQKGSFRFQQT